MMKQKFIYFLGCFIFLTTTGNAQNRALNKANKNFKKFEYYKAIAQYEKLVKNGEESAQIYKNLGDANYNNANYEEAVIWFDKLVSNFPNEIDKEHKYRYAQSLRSLKKYDESDIILEELVKSGISDNRLNKFSKNKGYIKSIKKRSGAFSIDALSINSEASDFAPSYRLEALVFSTARDTGIVSKNIHRWNQKKFLNLYTATYTDNQTFSNIIKFSDKINSKVHESSTTFSKDGNTVYFTRNNSVRGRIGRDKRGLSRLKIYKAVFKENKWTDIEALPFSSNDYSIAHPTLNANEDKLYFSSDMPGTYGASDIWVVDIHADGSYGEPKNLGPQINTESRETFPFIDKNNTLYFSSDGHPGLGGLDVFAIELDNRDSPNVINVGEPVNSIADDFSFIINPEVKKGYFASNRKGGVGEDDIYALSEIKPLDFSCNSIINGIVKNKISKEPVVDATVVIYNDQNEILAQGKSEANGAFQLTADCTSADYSVIANKENFEKDSQLFSNEKNIEIDGIELRLLPIKRLPSSGTNLIAYLKIPPIYFDFDRYSITNSGKIALDKIADFMFENPNILVEVRSHTDSRASDMYNYYLSEKRARATVAYMMEKGISAFRVSGKGFGEKQLTNDCGNGKKCTKEQHQRNRRSEVILVE